MEKGVFTRLGMFLAIVVTGIFLSGMSLAAEFTADMISKGPEGTFEGKVYVKGEKRRQESAHGGERVVTIIRQDKGVLWNLMPEERMYMEMPLIPTALDKAEAKKTSKEIAEKTYLGKERVNEYVCEKYTYTYRGKSEGTMTQWVSKELNLPIKTEMKDPKGTMHIEYKNIKREKLPNSLFEIPKGYTKFEIPGMDLPGR